ncbi:hypothetical protein RXS21_29760, partial [Pseudomonas aeruginosa]|nr:hypothetical protein [Pseudomonas aeruginosa]
IRAGVQPDSDPEREILIHLQEKLADMKANGISPTGIVFVIFGNDAEDKLFSSVHWMTSHMADQGSFAAAYAAMKIQSELFQ